MLRLYVKAKQDHEQLQEENKMLEMYVKNLQSRPPKGKK